MQFYTFGFLFKQSSYSLTDNNHATNELFSYIISLIKVDTPRAIMEPANSLFLFFLLLCLGCREAVRGDSCPENLRLLCHEQKSCGECMMAHSCCHWCYDQTDSIVNYRCDFKDALAQCGQNIEVNKESSVIIKRDLEFAEIKRATDATSAIQIKPQLFNVVLREDTPVNLSFTYKAAKNYPLQLYYLGDLSYSMKAHLETLKNLGDALGNSLEKLTKHYKLAYGSFLDKPGMPFTWMDENNLNNPCRTDAENCERTYLFKHRLNFTSDTNKFFEQVRNSKISANVDDLDGALEAIFQILVCDNKFGWSEHSRKIILLSTDSLLHTEGDGILAGANHVNIHNLCLVNSTGDHTAPLKYDYPSLGQIKTLLRQYKANLIVAVTQDKKKPYERMEKDILEQEAFVGVLEQNSKNILDLVKKGFYDFIRQVEFSVNSTHAPELDVKFYGACFGLGDFNETSGCQNVEEDTPMQFKLQISLKESTSKFSEQIFVKEKNINEELEINIDYQSKTCKCPNYRLPRDVHCVHGTINCGTCICDLGWIGGTCSEECNEDPQACRKEGGIITCSGRGNCLCGKCNCPQPYTGEFCEFKCPTDAFNQICSGKGTCFEGVCTCQKGYAKDDCSCEESVDECRLGQDSTICSGKGECECNTCRCEDGYTGKYCEVFAQKNALCEKYEDYVKDQLSQNKTGDSFVDGKTLLIEEWEDQQSCGSDSCSTVYFSSQAQRCLINYCYRKGENNTVHLGTTNKRCVFTAQAKGFGLAISAFFAVLIGGIIIILVRKCQIYREEQAEYKKFVAESGNLNEMNPLYVSPVSEYRNPMAR